LAPGVETVTEPPEELTGEPPLTPDAPLARRVTEVIRSGDAVELQQLLDEHPVVARVRIGDPERGQSRTLLHVVTDWPGHVPEAGTKIEALVAAGADVDARFTGPHSQAARQFPHAQVIDVPNAWHGPEREATGCALSITSDFIRNQRLGDTSCLAKIPSLPVK
jgi:hypothetical protein